MTETVPRDPETSPEREAAAMPERQRRLLHVGVALVCGLIGFLLVAQVRATEEVGERLEGEREEDLARILSDLSTESDRLQSEITELRLLLIEFEGSQETEQLALRTLQRRLDDLRILAGIAAAEGEGLSMVIDDPDGQVGQELLVDVVQELRDAGAEVIAINGIRLVVSSAFTTRNERLLLDGSLLGRPYRVQAIGPAQTMESALRIPGGAVSTLESRPGVRVTLETLAQLSVPGRDEVPPFVFGEPVLDDETG